MPTDHDIGNMQDRLDAEQAAEYARRPFQDRLPVWGRNGVSSTRDATEEEIEELRKLHKRR